MPVEFIYVLIFMIIFPVVSFTGMIDCFEDRNTNIPGALCYFTASAVSFIIGSYFIFKAVLGFVR